MPDPAASRFCLRFSQKQSAWFISCEARRGCRPWATAVTVRSDRLNQLNTRSKSDNSSAQPNKLLEPRHRLEADINRSQLVSFRGTEAQKTFWRVAEVSMKQRLRKKPFIFDSMVPDYPPGCKRLTPGPPGFLEALCEDNVDFIGNGAAEVSGGIWDNNGQFHDV